MNSALRCDEAETVQLSCHGHERGCHSLFSSRLDRTVAKTLYEGLQ